MRRKKLCISADLLADFLKIPTPPGISAEGMPSDASIVGAAWDFSNNSIVLFVDSAEFSEIAVGSEPPQMLVTFHESERNRQTTQSMNRVREMQSR
jgi:hypothetical protein